MQRRSIAIPLACLAVAAVARADTVQLPYASPDANGSQWMVFFNGNLQQQGNQPIFSQAGMITVNGMQPQRNVQTASYDDKNKEVTVNFVNRNGGGFTQTRRIQFADSGPVRILDIFDNPGGQDVSLNVSLMTNCNFGVNDTQLLSDPKHKDVPLGWAANTGADRAAMSLFGGRGTKNPPTIRYQPTNNNVVAQFNLKVPAKGRATLVHWHGTFDNADAAVQWTDKLNESKALGDLPADLRKSIVNLGAAGGFASGMDLLRGTTTDVVELRGGDTLRGDLKAESYTLKTAYGDVTLPAAKVAGLLSVGDFRPRQLLVTTGGEIFGGELQQPTVPITLSGGQSTQVPLGQINRLGYRAPPGEPPEWKFDGAMAFLASGERVLIDTPADPIELVTRYGTIKLTPDQVSTVVLSPAAATHTVYLADGSRLSGVLTRATWDLKLLSTTTADQAVSFPLATLARVQLKPLPDGVGAGQATIGLLGEDLISARLEQPLKIVTAFDTLTVAGPEIQSITRPQPGQADVQITTFDQSTFRGTLAVPTVTVKLTAGPTLEIPIAAIRDYQNPRPYPAAGVVTRANDAIAQLGGDDWKQREAAEATLTGMGIAIAPILEAALPGQPPEAQERLTGILKKLKKDQPLPPSRLTPPPAME